MAKEYTPAEIEAIRQGSAIKSVRGELDYMVSGLEKSTKAKVYEAIRAGQLTPEQAVTYWMEMYAYSRLGTRINEMSAKGE